MVLIVCQAPTIIEAILTSHVGTRMGDEKEKLLKEMLRRENVMYTVSLIERVNYWFSCQISLVISYCFWPSWKMHVGICPPLSSHLKSAFSEGNFNHTAPSFCPVLLLMFSAHAHVSPIFIVKILHFFVIAGEWCDQVPSELAALIFSMIARFRVMFLWS